MVKWIFVQSFARRSRLFICWCILHWLSTNKSERCNILVYHKKTQWKVFHLTSLWVLGTSSYKNEKVNTHTKFVSKLLKSVLEEPEGPIWMRIGLSFSWWSPLQFRTKNCQYSKFIFWHIFRKCNTLEFLALCFSFQPIRGVVFYISDNFFHPSKGVQY